MSGLAQTYGQNLRIPIDKKIITNNKGIFKSVKLSVSQIEGETKVVFSEIHNTLKDSLATVYLDLGNGEAQFGKLPSRFSNPEKWQITLETGEGHLNNYVHVFSMPITYFFWNREDQNSGAQKAKAKNRISTFGDTLYYSENNKYLILQGISTANYTVDGETMNSNHSCSLGDVHNPALTYGWIQDQEGNNYKTIRIGKQEWMAENLKVAHFQNGDLIPKLSEKKEWKKTKLPAFCWYSNDSALYDCPYGKLYNAWVAKDVRNICPVSWHVPTQQDWILLINVLGGKDKVLKSLKTAGPKYWLTNACITGDNSSGFSALPGAARFKNGDFYDIGKNSAIGYFGLWWSNKEFSEKVIGFGLLSDNNDEDSNFEFLREIEPGCGLSIRCIRDEKK